MNGAKQAGGRGDSSVGSGSSREQIAGFEAALRAYLRNQLDFPALRQELEDALYADLSCAPLTLDLIEELYQQGTLPPRPYTALKDDVEKTIAEESGRTEVLSDFESSVPPEGLPAAEPAVTVQRPQEDAGGDRTLPIGRAGIHPTVERKAAAEAPEAGSAADRTLPIRRSGAPAIQGAPAAKRPAAAPKATPGPFEAGHVLRNRFVLQSRIGAGGMGIVYRALDRRKQEAHDGNPYVALKILRHEFRQRPDSLSSLQQEALKAQRLTHPNIVNVFDFDRDGDAVFMTMELLEGESLARLMNRLHPRRLPGEQAMAIIAGMARGLAYAHEQNIIHYDFKPGNVVLTHDGRIKILDFGIARAAPEDTLYTFDSGQLNAMTPAYASCEMLQEGEPDPRDDIYGLACVSYELLAGRHPFNRQSAVRARQQKMKPPRIKGLKRAQWKALERGLRFTRADRTPSAGQFLLDIQDGSTTKPEAEVAYSGLVKRPPPLPRKGKGLGVLVLAALVAVGAYFADAFLQWFETDRETPPGELTGPPADTEQGAAPEEARTGDPAEPELETIEPVPDPTIVTTDERAPAAETEAASLPAEPDAQPAPEGVAGGPATTTQDASPPRPETGEAATEPATPEPAAEDTLPAAEPEAGTAVIAEAPPAIPPGPGRIAFARRDYSINESGSVLVIEVTREAGATGEVAVAFATDDGSAKADRDFGRFDLSVLTFAEGEMRRELYVPIVSDALVEDDETFYVTLMNPSGGAELGEFTTATVTIGDDDF
ncbi:MAG: protein kinase domain-containing protein [Gammaproteobacteria bacterium]